MAVFEFLNKVFADYYIRADVAVDEIIGVRLKQGLYAGGKELYGFKHGLAQLKVGGRPPRKGVMGYEKKEYEDKREDKNHNNNAIVWETSCKAEKKKINIGVMDFNDEFSAIVKGLRARLQYLGAAGIKDLCSIRLAHAPQPVEEPLEAIKARVSACALCPERDGGPLFGAGPACPVIMFITGAPSNEDIKKGKPLSGDDGAQLAKIIGWMGTELGIKDLGQRVFITNSIKCAFRSGASPKACREILMAQIKALSPSIVIVLGDGPAGYLFDRDAGSLRGELHEIEGIKTIVTHGPETLLERPELKRETMEDMLMAIRELRRA